MEYWSLLFFGCLIGMQHALEADHLAAIAALSAKRSSRRALVLRGGIWGIGHTFTLLLICGLLLLLGEAVPPRVDAGLELIVGIMIVILGANVLYTLWKRRPHIHVHEHKDGRNHVHVHSHADELVAHTESQHRHEHRHLGLRRALLVGMVHGAAGSAGLLVLAAAAESVGEAAGYVLSFGAGSIIGMAALSFVASYPLRVLERSANWLNAAAYIAIAGVAIVVGGGLIEESWRLL